MPKTKVLDISQSSAQLILKSNSLLLAISDPGMLECNTIID